MSRSASAASAAVAASSMRCGFDALLVERARLRIVAGMRSPNRAASARSGRRDKP